MSEEKNVQTKIKNWWHSQGPERKRMIMLFGLVGAVVLMLIITAINTPGISPSGSDQRTSGPQVDPNIWGGGRSNVAAIEDLARTVDALDREWRDMRKELRDDVQSAVDSLNQTRESFIDWTENHGVQRRAARMLDRAESVARQLDELEKRLEETQLKAAGVQPFDPNRRQPLEPRPRRPDPPSPRPEPSTEPEPELDQDLFAGVGTTPRPQTQALEAGSQERAAPQRPEPRRRTGLMVNGRTLAALQAEEEEKRQADEEREAQEAAAEAEREPKPRRTSINDEIPPGSIVSGVMLHGVDAPTGSGARGNPVPILIRIKDTTILPNFYSANFEDCHVIGAAFGRLSEERMFARLEDLACVDDEGGIVHTKIEGYVVGPDGQLGVRGPVVHRNGALLARSLQAGILSGFGQAFGGRRGGIVISRDGGLPTEDLRSVGEEGLARGIGTALQKVSEYYLNLAEQIFPVIVVEPETPLDIVLNAPLPLD